MIQLSRIAIAQDAPPHGPIRQTLRLLIPRSGLTGGDVGAAVKTAIATGQGQLARLRRPPKPQRQAKPVAERTYLTPPQYAAELGVSEDKVLAWIAAGELQAFNAAQSAKSKRPRWRIMREEIARFEKSRATTPPPEKPKQRKKRRKPTRQWF